MMETEIFPTKSYSEIKQGLPASALKVTGGAYDGGSENYIVETKIYENHRRDARYGETETAPTLTAQMGTGGGNVPLKIEKGVCLCQVTGMSRNGPICKEKIAFTLTSVDRYCTVAIGKDSSHLIANGIAHTLTAYDYKAQQAVFKRGEAFVRRLTPLECERLQGLPDNWTEGGSDAKRYKAIGNGMAQPCADFVIEKLVEALKERG
jgi:DNA (cytosine-5)-methyltransferase 1